MPSNKRGERTANFTRLTTSGDGAGGKHLRQKRKPDALLFAALLAGYTLLGLAFHWYMHRDMSYAVVRDEMSLDVVSAALTWIVAWYRWHKADSA